MAASAKIASSKSSEKADASAASSIRSTPSTCLTPPAFAQLTLEKNGNVLLRVPLASLPSVSAETGHTPQMIFERLCGHLVTEASKLKIKILVSSHSAAPVSDDSHHRWMECRFSQLPDGTPLSSDEIRKLEECLASCWSQLSEEYDAAVMEKVARSNGDAVQPGASS